MYYTGIPKEIADEMNLRERQKVVVKRQGRKIIISDWTKN